MRGHGELISSKLEGKTITIENQFKKWIRIDELIYILTLFSLTLSNQQIYVIIVKKIGNDKNNKQELLKIVIQAPFRKIVKFWCKVTQRLKTKKIKVTIARDLAVSIQQWQLRMR
ncbi:unnamed protein product (macronuclear) [Paramecium tetraurelia]|uniref:Uncharacterized protein n=1 Tax=Paramecium tetraurelia TaxID=5888 RepID=A0D5H2_PARTE|nr:uncharacterized protein GSPATT00039272001 [Paramecium tetraurelia]CAK78289.1 unnamed protein product [Paramecium tetraurelia]|eukprot:XP_001445686.1 hypothetical protein (macronuclear) [Paramecium tetraurelia strain d4-2]